MPAVKSLDDLRRLQAEALARRAAEQGAARAEITIGLGTPGLAAGAVDTQCALRDLIEQEHLQGIRLRQTGSFGPDSCEPVISVAVGGQPPVLYAHVTPAVARRILHEHVLGGQVVAEHLLHAHAGGTARTGADQ